MRVVIPEPLATRLSCIATEHNVDPKTLVLGATVEWVESQETWPNPDAVAITEGNGDLVLSEAG